MTQGILRLKCYKEYVTIFAIAMINYYFFF